MPGISFWSRLRELKRFSSLYPSRVGTNQPIYYRTLVPALNGFSSRSRFEASHTVRFYAAPPEKRNGQGDTKKEENREPVLNENITAPSVRLVTDEGHFIISRYEALGRAKSLRLDLVMVDGQAKPPVCKIFDFKKDKYLQQMKEKERAKSKSTLKKGSPKEIRFTGKITKNDLQVKADMVKRLMESGHRVKCTAIEPTDSSDMEMMLSRFSAMIEDVAIVESGPKVEKKQAFVVVRHVKFGPMKKGPGKKAIKATAQNEDSDDLTDQEDAQANDDIPEDIHPVSDRYAAEAPPPPPPKPEIENRYAKVPPPKPEMGNRYAKVGEMESGYQNRYARAAPPSRPGSGISTNPRFVPPDRIKQTDVSPHREGYSRGGSFGAQTVPDRSSGEVANRYRRNSPPDSGRTPSPPYGGGFSRRPGGENSGQGRWGGAFSSDNS